jgi:hypothetical protein
MAQGGTHTVRVTLVQEPSVYRELEVDSSKSLYGLAEAIVAAFGFDFDHAFGFYSGRTERTLMSAKPKYELFADMGKDAFGDESDALSVKKTRIVDAFPKVGHAMTFLFDYGDEWLFHVEVVGLGQKVAKIRYPRVLKKAGEAPEQYPDPDEDDAERTSGMV